MIPFRIFFFIVVLYVELIKSSPALGNEKDTNDNEYTDECFHGEYLDDECVCPDGWTGKKCQHCDGRLLMDKSSGYISDGNYEFNRFVDCMWLIKLNPMFLDEGKTLRININDDSISCNGVSLFVYDGDSKFSPLLAAYSGIVTPGHYVTPSTLIASSGVALLKFSSEQSVRHSGYEIDYVYENVTYEPGDEEGRYLYTHLDNWSSSEWEGLTAQGRGSSSASLYENYLYIYGGFIFGGENLHVQMLRFNQLGGTVKAIRPNSEPMPRFGHSMITWNDSFIVFGGITLKDYKITNELWSFNITTEEWSLMETCVDCTEPPRLMGHTAHLVETSDGREVMLVIFGFHPQWEYSSFVFEYDIMNNKWKKLSTQGATHYGSYGHASALDSDNNLIYVHGGINSQDVAELNDMFVFDVEQKHWNSLKPSNSKRRFLHSLVYVNNSLLVFGGRVAITQGDCDDTPFESYDIASDTWKELKRTIGSADNRYGHTAVAVDNQMYVYGGFDGAMHSDMLTYSVVVQKEECSNITDADVCSGSPFCTWDIEKCIELQCVDKSAECDLCYSKCDEFCSSRTSCVDCLSTALKCCKCSYCPTCTQKCYPDSSSMSTTTSPPLPPGNATVYDISSCDEDEILHEFCNTFHNCFSCGEADGCEWNYLTCRPGNGSSTCSPACSEFTNCSDCTSVPKCSWCDTTHTCIPTSTVPTSISNAYYPYSTCRDWRFIPDQCKDQCETATNCDDCAEMVGCGWCATDVDTGVGTCMSGGHKEPLNATCDGKWSFIECPECQCNGHTTCTNTDECGNCTDHTVGPKCETCDMNYYGNPVNGGNCSECLCNGHATQCSDEGICYCQVSGTTGDHCERCDPTHNVSGDASNGTCYYQIQSQYRYEYLQQGYITQMNFEFCPNALSDLLLTVADMEGLTQIARFHSNLTYYYKYNGQNVTSDMEILYRSYYNTTMAQFFLRNKEFKFDRNPLCCFRLYLEFTTPFYFYVKLVRTYTNIGLLLGVFFSCFLLLLILAIVAWKLNNMLMRCRTRRNREIELAEMAARPVGCIDFEYQYKNELNPEVFVEETASDELATVGSALLWMPFGKSAECTEPYFAIGSALFATRGGKTKVKQTARWRRSTSQHSSASFGVDNPVLELQNENSRSSSSASA